MTGWASIEEAMTNGWGIERAFVCHVHDDHNASASINSMTGLWFCYSCHARGSFDMTKIDPDPYEVRRAVDRFMEQFEAESRIYPESWLSQFDSTGPGEYWLKRYSHEVARKHRLGKYPDQHAATIPFRDNAGRVLGVIRRDLTGLDPAKYRYPSGVDMQNYLYNYHRVQGRVILLTEGATDAIAADEGGFPDAMAVYGSHLSTQQRRLICKLDPDLIICAFDQDKAGDDGAHEVAARLPYYRVERMEWPRVWKDLNSIPLPIRSKLLEKVLTTA